MTVRYGSLPFREAIDFFRGKLNLPTEHWDDLRQGEHAKAFTVAGATKAELLADLRQAVDRAIADGKSLSAFKKEFREIAARRGWTGWAGEGSAAGTAWRANVIYSTNMRQAYNAGRWQQLQQFPLWQYRHGDSRSPRVLHLSWNNLVLPKEHPWWRTHFPQNGYGCKCWVSGMSEATARRRGLQVGPAPVDGTYDYVNRRTGEVIQVPKGIDPGFDYSVGEAAFGRRLSAEAMKEWQGKGAQQWESLTPGGWQNAGRPERMPLLPAPGQLASRLTTQPQVIAALRQQLGGEERVFSSPAGPVLVNAVTLGEHMAPDRAEYLPLLSDVIANPYEIWLTFERHRATGKIAIKARYITAYDLRDGRGLLAVFNVVKGMLVSWTLLPTSKLKYIEKERRGMLLWGRQEDGASP